MIELENEGFDATFGPGSPATYLNGTLRPKGELLQNYYATGHASLDNYISQVSGQAPTKVTQADCLSNGALFANVTPGTPDANQTTNPGPGRRAGLRLSRRHQDDRLTARRQVHSRTPRRTWPPGGPTSRTWGTRPPATAASPTPPAAPTAPTRPSARPLTSNVATADDQYATRHNPFVWFHSVIDSAAECNANVVPLGTLAADGKPSPSGHLAKDLHSESTTPRFGFITPNLCNDGHDATCAGPNSTGGHVGGLTGADQFLQAWMPLILGSPAYKHGDLLVVVTFDEADLGGTDAGLACCNEQPGPNTPAPGNAGATMPSEAPGGGQIGALLLNPKYVVAGSTDTTGSYNHYSALRSYEDLLGLTTGGNDGQGHLGFAAAKGLVPFGTDVFPAKLSGKK